MQRTLLQDMPPDALAAAQPNIVASLIVESSRAEKPRPLIHLGTVAGKNVDPANTAPVCALGIPVSGNVAWHEVGHLDLQTAAMERALFAGMSVLAMKHVREADVQIGDAVLVVGADPWSLLLLQWAKLQGASPLVYVRRGPHSLSEQAASFGVDAQLSDPTASDLARAVKLTHRGGGFAVVLDAIASEQSMTQSLSTLRDGGRYMLAGIDPQPHVLLNAYPDLHRRDLEMVAAPYSPMDPDFADRFRFSLKLADEQRLQLDRLLDPSCGWRVEGRDRTLIA